MDFNTIQSLQEAYQEVNENLLGSLDKVARDTAGKVGETIGREKASKVPGANIPGLGDIIKGEGGRRGRNQGQQMYDKAKETVGGLLNQEYEPDAFDIVLEYLVAEGYADTNKAAIAIMSNMSEEWRQDIVEKYVDYRKGKLASGKTPKEKLTNKLERTKVAASREQSAGGSSGPTATPSWKRAKKAGQVKDEMDDNTSTAGKVRKVIHLGRRDNAGPSVQRGEPNTERHQRAIDAREKSEK